jgi:hypothetical protein
MAFKVLSENFIEGPGKTVSRNERPTSQNKSLRFQVSVAVTVVVLATLFFRNYFTFLGRGLDIVDYNRRSLNI